MLAREYGQMIGQGSYRIAYLFENVVYKYLTYEWDANENWNQAEFEVICALRNSELSPIIYIPEASLYDDVIAMEYIDGEPCGQCVCFNKSEHSSWCMPDADYMTLRRETKLDDLSPDNVIKMTDGRYAPIDLQFYMG